MINILLVPSGKAPSGILNVVPLLNVTSPPCVPGLISLIGSSDIHLYIG